MMIQSGAFLGNAIFALSPSSCLLLLIAYRKITDQPSDRDDVIVLCKAAGIITLIFVVGLIFKILIK
jgi:hypothetical protein